jgi:2-C-methyl-D-erythritol 2,4-cyclodiphosphate synthase
MEIRIGTGYDIHTLIDGDGIMLGGIKVPFHKQFKAHSDGDVLIHAIIDSLLGAMALGDIGTHFPDTDPAFKGADSRELLKHTCRLMEKQGYEIGNIDTTIICEKPKLMPFIADIRKALADILQTETSQISVKAKTKEKMDATGGGLSIEVHSSCLIRKK